MSAAAGTITALVGTVVLRLTITGEYKRYIRPGMAPLLVIAGVALVLLGAVTFVRSLRDEHKAAEEAEIDEHREHHDHHGHHDHHDHGSERVGWLLLAPVAVLLLVAPPTLGSFGVDRAPAVDVRSAGGGFDPLPASDEPVAMTLLEFGQRAFDGGGDGASFNGAAVQLTGFVADSEPTSFRLARYQIACCAADAAAMVVRVGGINGAPPARDRWVTVTGTFQRGGTDVPELSAISVHEIPAPDDPYE